MVRLHATSDGGAFPFPTRTPITVTFDFKSSPLGPSAPPTFVTVTKGCRSTESPAFEANTTFAELALKTAGFGTVALQAEVAGVVSTSPNLKAKAQSYLPFPRNGGMVTPVDGGLCVEYDITTQAFQTFMAGTVRAEVQAMALTHFELDFAPMLTPSLATDCSTLSRIVSVPMAAGTSRAPFAIVFSPDTATGGTFGIMVRTPQALNPGSGIDVEPSATRFCTPNGGTMMMAPGSQCSAALECCGLSTVCATVPGMSGSPPQCL